MRVASEWEISSVAQEFDVQLGKRLDAAVNRGEIRWCINNRGVRWGRVIADEAVQAPLTAADIRDLRLEAGDVLMCEGGEVGRSAMWNRELTEAYFLNTLHRLRSKGRYNPRLLVAFFERWANTGELSALVGKATLAHLTKENLLRVPLPVLSASEQERVVGALSDIASVITSLERLITKKRALTHGLMQELLTGRTRLHGFSKPWQLIRLGDYVKYVKTVALSRAQLDSSSPLRYLHYGDIHTRLTSVLDASVEDMPRAPRALARNAGLLQVGDLVLADASEDPDGVGRSVEITGVPIDGVVPGLHTIAARFDKRVLADGFKRYLQFIAAFRTQLLALAAGTKVLATTRAYMSRIELSLPEVSEQVAIADVLRDANLEIEALERRLRATRAIKQGMMQELLTGRTRLVSTEASA
jgi:type I restriction enzyme, S subunit